MAGLDDFPDIRRSIDDAVDEAELLPNCYQKMPVILPKRLN
jgi:hypothetical protein